MVKIMDKNRIIMYVTTLLLILLISIPAVIKAINKHNDRLVAVAVGEIIVEAKNCYYNESCIGDTITLSELYEKTSLREVINPITKKFYNPDSYVDVKNNLIFIEK